MHPDVSDRTLKQPLNKQKISQNFSAAPLTRFDAFNEPNVRHFHRKRGIILCLNESL